MSLSAMYPHRIRLRGPWECEPATPQAAKSRRVVMPCRWLDAGLGDYRGLARFTRNFGYPGNVDETEHVWLTCDGCTGCEGVTLNGQQLPTPAEPTWAFDVTSTLKERNRLEVLIRGDSELAGLWGEVAMEIRKDAYLANVQVECSEAVIHLSGEVVGTSPQPLELYALVDGRHVDYRTVPASAAGTRFDIDLPRIGDPQFVRLELIRISSIWYVMELPIPHWQSS